MSNFLPLCCLSLVGLLAAADRHRTAMMGAVWSAALERPSLRTWGNRYCALLAARRWRRV